MKYNSAEVTNLLAEDEGDWQIIEGKDTQRKRDNADMMVLKIKGWDKNGKEGIIFAYVSEPWQLKRICESADKIDLFNKNEISAADMVGWTGRGVFKSEVDQTGQYEDKTIISKWIKHDGSAGRKQEATEEKPPFDDDIPF